MADSEHATSTTGEDEGTQPLGRLEGRAAFVLIIVFLLALVGMVLLRTDQHWDRLVYLFGALEALVFAGAGALFGTSIQRSNVADARRDAVQAQATAAEAREVAEARGQEAERGRTLAAAVRATDATLALARGASARHGAREDGGIADATAATEAQHQVASLRALVDELFPRNS